MRHNSLKLVLVWVLWIGSAIKRHKVICLAIFTALRFANTVLSLLGFLHTLQKYLSLADCSNYRQKHNSSLILSNRTKLNIIKF